MKWYSYLICCILIIIGVFCTIELIEVFSVKSGEYGNVISYQTHSEYEEFSKYDFGSIDFQSENFIDYKNVSTFGAENFDGTKQEYTLFFNGQPLNNVVQTAGRISGNCLLKFKNLNGEDVCIADVHFVVEYLASETRITSTITNENNSVSYLNSYMEINGAVLQVVSKGGNL